MKIIIVGCGKVGMTLIEQLNDEGHDITVIDNNHERLQNALNQVDVNGVVGNGTSFRVQLEADIKHADLLIAVTDSDEINLLSCLIAKKAGNCSTIARVRDPEYFQEIRYLKEELGLSMAINPEFAAASEIARLIQVPSALEIDTFAKGRVNLVRCIIPEGSILDGKKIKDLSSKLEQKILICIVERNHTVMIPNGDTTLYANDSISLIIPPKDIVPLFNRIGIRAKAIHNVIIAGGGTISYYLAKRLSNANVHVKIIEKSKERCEFLSEALPNALVINGDASDQQLLMEEGIHQAEAFVSLTNLDEENILLSLYANQISTAKRITKINRIAFEDVIKDIPVGSVICPKNITSERIIQYIRSFENSMGSNVESLYRMMDNRIEALEFYIRGENALTVQTLQSLSLKDNLLICCIVRANDIITPGGRDVLLPGDTVIVVTTHKGLNDIEEILK